jgi:hypothetical protein
MVNIRNRAERDVELNESSIEFRRVSPFENHKVTNTGDSVCELLVICSEAFNPADPDTFGVGK